MQLQNPLENFSFTDPFSTWWPFIFAAIVGIITTIRSYIVGPECSNSNSMEGKTVIITGGSNGLGQQVALQLLDRKSSVIVATSNVEATKTIFKKLYDEKKVSSIERLQIKEANLASFQSIRAFVKNIDESQIEFLVNSAGVAFQPFKKTEDSLEFHLQVNYLGHFLLTHLLLPKLQASTEAGIVNVSAHIHHKGEINLDDLNLEKNYSSATAFSQSKLALLLFTCHMSKNLQGSNVRINAVNPGIIRGTRHTNKSLVSQSHAFKLMAGPATWLFTKTPRQASQTILHLITCPDVKEISGRYFSNCSEITPSTKATNLELAAKLYKKSMELIK